jgi:hypothetical protein
MSETESLLPRTLPPLNEQSRLRGVLQKLLPYAVMLALALAGIAYTDVLPRHSIWYWQLLTVVFGLICIVSEWPKGPDPGRARVRLVVTQVLHWGLFLLAMRLLFLPVMQKNLDADITGMVLMYMLAFSTLLAGIYVNWRLAIPGVFLGVGAVAVAFLDQASALMMVIAGVIIAAVWIWHHMRPATR